MLFQMYQLVKTYWMHIATQCLILKVNKMKVILIVLISVITLAILYYIFGKGFGTQSRYEVWKNGKSTDVSTEPIINNCASVKLMAPKAGMKWSCIDGEWKQVKAGDVHVNPRGNVHATRVGADEDLQFVSIFTPALPAGGDANFLE